MTNLSINVICHFTHLYILILNISAVVAGNTQGWGGWGYQDGTNGVLFDKSRWLLGLWKLNLYHTIKFAPSSAELNNLLQNGITCEGVSVIWDSNVHPTILDNLQDFRFIFSALYRIYIGAITFVFTSSQGHVVYVWNFPVSGVLLLFQEWYLIKFI